MESRVVKDHLINWSVDITVQKTPSIQNQGSKSKQAGHLDTKYRYPTTEQIHRKIGNDSLSYLPPSVAAGKGHTFSTSFMPKNKCNRQSQSNYGHPTSETSETKGQFKDVFRAQNLLSSRGCFDPSTPQYGRIPPGLGYPNSRIIEQPNFEYGYATPRNGHPTSKYGNLTSRNGHPTPRNGYPTPRNGHPTSEYGYATPRNGQPASEYGYHNLRNGQPNSKYGNLTPRNGHPTSKYGYSNPRNGQAASEFGFPNPRSGQPTSEYRYPPTPKNVQLTSEYIHPNPKNGYSTPDYGYLTPEVILLENRNEDGKKANNFLLESEQEYLAPELVLIKEEDHDLTTGQAEELSHGSDETLNGFQNQTSTLDQNYPSPELVLVKEDSDLDLEDENEPDSDELDDSFEREASEEESDSCNHVEHEDFVYNFESTPKYTDSIDPNTKISESLSEWIWCKKCMDYYHRNESHSCNQSKSSSGKPKKSKKVKPFSCTHCVRKFARVDQLVKHLKNRLGICPYICPVCCAYFGEHSDLLSHDCKKLAERGEENSFKCLDCGKVFSGKNYLSKHQKRHLAVKRFKCATCGKLFAEKYHLARHQVTHTNVKDLTCNECGKSFALRNNLIVHQRIHLGIRPYKCSHCGRSFFQNVNRLAHELTHTGERPFKCVCRAEYSSRYLLNKHWKTCKKMAKRREARKSTKGMELGEVKKNKTDGDTSTDECGAKEVDDDLAVVEDIKEVDDDVAVVEEIKEESRCETEEVQIIEDDIEELEEGVQLVSETQDLALTC